jgi:hypothetical protein
MGKVNEVGKNQSEMTNDFLVFPIDVHGVGEVEVDIHYRLSAYPKVVSVIMTL